MCERYIDQMPLPHPDLGTWPATQACALTRNKTSDLLIYRSVLNPFSHTKQGKENLKSSKRKAVGYLQGSSPKTAS